MVFTENVCLLLRFSPESVLHGEMWVRLMQFLRVGPVWIIKLQLSRKLLQIFNIYPGLQHFNLIMSHMWYTGYDMKVMTSFQ